MAINTKGLPISLALAKHKNGFRPLFKHTESLRRATSGPNIHSSEHCNISNQQPTEPKGTKSYDYHQQNRSCHNPITRHVDNNIPTLHSLLSSSSSSSKSSSSKSPFSPSHSSSFSTLSVSSCNDAPLNNLQVLEQHCSMLPHGVISNFQALALQPSEAQPSSDNSFPQRQSHQQFHQQQATSVPAPFRPKSIVFTKTRPKGPKFRECPVFSTPVHVDVITNTSTPKQLNLNKSKMYRKRKARNGKIASMSPLSQSRISSSLPIPCAHQAEKSHLSLIAAYDRKLNLCPLK